MDLPSLAKVFKEFTLIVLENILYVILISSAVLAFGIFKNNGEITKTKNISKYDMMYSTNRFGNQLLIDLMRKFPADDILKKYSDKQDFWCKKLGLEKTNSVHNAKSGDDLLWYAEHKHLVEDGVNQNLLNLVPLLENHKMIITYLEESGNMFHKHF